MGDLLVTSLLLMVEHQNSSFHRAELLQLILHRIPKLSLGKLLLSVGAGMWEAIFPVGLLVREGDEGALVTAAPLPLILRDVGDDAIEIGAEQGFATKGWKRPVEA
jgi:hypothetical protein